MGIGNWQQGKIIRRKRRSRTELIFFLFFATILQWENVRTYILKPT
ncbi:MAG: hypothetical protein F6K47_35185 [Symploca sp. SIO2E6]|nr:hypothetical protein [Symploca sp. SIO2E6]